ncbi:MAG TPA: hypothetical protein VGP93_04335, partial [Polyangiaceae bacterium]|nr:hypothetical protein [Polyangiaceae bacterium]
MRPLWLLWALPALAACGTPEPPEQPCLWLEQQVGVPGDTVVGLSPESYVLLSNAGSEPTMIRVERGDTAFREQSPGCVGSPDQPCSYELGRLRVVVNPFEIGELQVTDYGILLEGPVTLEDRGSGLDLTAAGAVTACARFDDKLVKATSAGLDFGTASVDSQTQEFALDVSYSAQFELKDGPPVVDSVLSGARIELFGNLSGSGEQPWLE